MLRLLCYNTEKPELLSKKQFVTRLYKNCVRTSFDRIYLGTASETREYFRNQVNAHRTDFLRMLDLDRNSVEFKRLASKYEKFIDDNYDITKLLFDNQPHSLNSSKVFTYPDEVGSPGAHVRPLRLLQG